MRPPFQRKAAHISFMTDLDIELKAVMYRGKRSRGRYDDRDACVHTACLGQCVCLAWQEGVSGVNECCMNCRRGSKTSHVKLKTLTLSFPSPLEDERCAARLKSNHRPANKQFQPGNTVYRDIPSIKFIRRGGGGLREGRESEVSRG